MVYVIALMFTLSMSRGTCVHCLYCGAVLTFSKPLLLPLTYIYKSARGCQMWNVQPYPNTKAVPILWNESHIWILHARAIIPILHPLPMLQDVQWDVLRPSCLLLSLANTTLCVASTRWVGPQAWCAVCQWQLILFSTNMLISCTTVFLCWSCPATSLPLQPW